MTDCTAQAAAALACMVQLEALEQERDDLNLQISAKEEELATLIAAWEECESGESLTLEKAKALPADQIALRAAMLAIKMLLRKSS